MKRQLDRAGMANWVHAPIIEGKVLFLPKGDVTVPVGTDIVHHTDVGQGGGDGGSNSSSPSNTEPIANDEIILGLDSFCSIIQNGSVLLAKNRTVDKQLDFCVKLGGSDLQPAPDRILWAAKNPNTFTIRLFPGETVPVVESGDWNGSYAASFSYGPVTDKNYLSMMFILFELLIIL